tara:strand:+ start:687 stop:911 length:225 start_codon:yes stop_codon:yes gene_type:complete
MINGKKIYKVTNGVREELSTLEYTQAKADLVIREKEKTAIQNIENLKTSAETKLKNLGLTENEVKSILGKKIKE